MSEDTRKKNATEPSASATDPEGSGRPTVAPPFDVEAFARRTTGPSTRSPPPSGPPDRSQQITVTNEAELEKARIESARVGTEPPRYPTASALSIVNARIPSSPSVPRATTPIPRSPTPAPRAPTPTSIEAAVLGVLNSSPPPEITERTILDPIAEMRERFSLGDYTGALEMAELILQEDPSILEAAECAENCRTVLEKMYVARLGPLDRAPAVVVPGAHLRWLSLDHRAGFVLSLIDGTSTVEMILDLSGMPRIDTLRILLELVQQKVVALTP
jgi:hypothetical protein